MLNVDYDKISITAKLVAYYRIFSDIPFASQVCEFINAKSAFEQIIQNLNIEDDIQRDKLSNDIKIYAPMLELRYKSIKQLIVNSNIKQVLELASGFSLRGLAFACDSRYICVETDLPQLNAEKIKLLNQIRLKCNLKNSHNYFVESANALDYNQLQTVLARFDKNQPIVIVNEGLIPYLSFDETKLLVQNIYNILNQFSYGIWITPDFSVKNQVQNVPDSIKRFRQAINSITDRPLFGSTFESQQNIDEFLSEFGLNNESFLQSDLVDDIKSVSELNLEPEIVSKLNSLIWKMNIK